MLLSSALCVYNRETIAANNSPYINRFIQPDTIIPNLYNPQYLNRFSYVRNNPIRYSDPTGHMDWEGEGGDYTLPDLDPSDYCDTHPGACGNSPPTDEVDEILSWTLSKQNLSN